MEFIKLLLIVGAILFISFAIEKIHEWLSKTEKVLSESFWWDTWNGLNYSRTTLYKYVNLPWYYLEHEINYRHPEEHPNYKEFLIKVEEIKKARVKKV